MTIRQPSPKYAGCKLSEWKSCDYRSVDISLGELLYGWSRTVQTIDGKQSKG